MFSSLWQAIDTILHADRFLETFFASYGRGIYGLLFVIVFCETGLVVTPFLPGDSLLFAVGALSARGMMDVWIVFALLAAAAILGDTMNYWIGHHLGGKAHDLVERGWIRERHLRRTETFFVRHGGRTIFLARFIPIVRTFAPFVAGVSRMAYGRFLAFNVLGGVVWVGVFVFGGYSFGNLPWVKERFSFMIGAIILLSLLPVFIEFLQCRRVADNPKKS